MTQDPEPVAAGVDTAGVATVGGLLRERRLQRGLKPEDIGIAIRFRACQIVAVEAGRFAELPPHPYARGLIRAYAIHVGLEPNELLRICGPAFSGEGTARGGRIFYYPLRDRSSWREWTAPIVFAAAVVIIVVARALLLPAPEPLIAPDTVPTARVQPAQPAAAPALEPASAEANAGNAAGPAPAAGQPAVSVAAAGVRVLLRSEGKTWAEAAPDGGEVRRYELGPGQNLELAARERLLVSLGDAGVIRLKVNDRELGFIGYKGETKVGLSFVPPKAPPAGAPRPPEGD